VAAKESEIGYFMPAAKSGHAYKLPQNLFILGAFLPWNAASAPGQNSKYSSRTDVFRFGSELGHCPTAGISHLCQQATLTEGALPAVCLFGTGSYAAVVRVLKIGLAVCPLLARVFANRLTLVGTIFLGTEKEPLYSALRCSWGFFGARAHGQENQNQDHRRGC
jgi:hypothetical protein